MLDFLLQNISIKRTPKEWCELIDVNIIDWDGWATIAKEQPCSLAEFVDRVSRCTIEIPKKERRATITFRPGNADDVVEIYIDDSGLTAYEREVLESGEVNGGEPVPVFVGLAAGIHRLIRRFQSQFQSL